MPPAPVRPSVATPYRFHTYSYPGDALAGAFQLSGGLPSAGGWQFYSLEQDLAGLVAVGVARGVPNIALAPIIVGNPTGGARRTLMLSFGNRNRIAGRPTVVITGGIHAREWIAAEIAYLIAEYLIVNYVGGLAVPANPRLAQLKALVDGRNLRIIPMVNPDGNDYTVFTANGAGRLWRKNRRPLPVNRNAWVTALVPVLGGIPVPPLQNVSPWWGILPWASYDVPDYDPPNGRGPGQAVHLQGHRLPNDEFGIDLNRNMATNAWGYDARPGFVEWDPSGGSFFGTAPGGEPETGNVQTAMGAPPAVINVAIDYHCYGGAILYPSETFYAGPLGADYTSTGQMMQSLIRIGAAGAQYNLGDPAHVLGLGYDATGTVADYAAQQRQARAFTIELDTAGQPGPGGGFLTQPGQIQAIFEKNIRGALAAITAPVGPVAPGQVTAQYAYANWPVVNHGNQVP